MILFTKTYIQEEFRYLDLNDTYESLRYSIYMTASVIIVYLGTVSLTLPSSETSKLSDRKVISLILVDVTESIKVLES